MVYLDKMMFIALTVLNSDVFVVCTGGLNEICHNCDFGCSVQMTLKFK